MEQHILNYLQDHPNAEDTIEGITEWWLLEEEIRLRYSEVEKAVTRLVESGAMEQVPGPGEERRRYRLAKQ